LKSEIREFFSIKELGRTLAAVFGTLIFALAVNLLIVPAGVYSDGLMGICQVIRTVLVRYLHIDFGRYDIAGIIYYLINIPLFFVAYKSMGKLFFIKTMICTVSMTLFLLVVPIPSQLVIRNDLLTTVLIGGIASGFGIGLILIMGGSSGGIDIVGLYYVKYKRRAGVGAVALAVNTVLYLACFLLFDITTTVYSLIVAVASSITIDRLHAQNINVEVTIIAKSNPKLQAELMERMGRGLSKWLITGAYSNESFEILYIILSKYEIGQLRQLVRKYDPEAFVVANEGVRVFGNFEKKV
jgi:uncharacterized membrane-anchored protein YitT (DUF2179 family)